MVGLIMTYNQENTCIAAIESLISQTQELDLILVSDDCSTDSTFTLIQEFCEKITTGIKIEYYKNSRNLGLIAHFNLLVQKYLIFSDLIFSNSGDDESEPTRVWEFFSRYQALGSPRYYLGHSYVRSDDRGKSEIRIPPIQSIKEHPDLLPVSSAYHIGASQVFSGALFFDFGPILFDDCYEDLTLGYRALLKNAYDFVPKPLVRYRSGGISNWQKNPLEKKRGRFCSTLKQRVIDSVRSGDLDYLSIIYDCYIQYGFSLKPHIDRANVKVIQGQEDHGCLAAYTVSDHFYSLTNVCKTEVLTSAEAIDQLSSDRHDLRGELLWIVVNRLSTRELVLILNRLSETRVGRVVIDIGLGFTPADSEQQRDTLQLLEEFLTRVPHCEVHTSCPDVYRRTRRGAASNCSMLLPLENIDGPVIPMDTQNIKSGLVVLSDNTTKTMELLHTVKNAFYQRELKKINLDLLTGKDNTIPRRFAGDPLQIQEVGKGPNMFNMARYDFLIVLNGSRPSKSGLVHYWWLQGAKVSIPTFMNAFATDSDYLSHGKNALFVDENERSWGAAFDLINLEFDKLKLVSEQARDDAYFNFSLQKRISDLTSVLGGYNRSSPFFDKFFPL
jgi:glycosyltransferase involved in cell wall biosynthesis